MSLLKTILPSKEPNNPTPPPVPQKLADAIARGRKAVQKHKTEKQLSVKFWQGDQYWYQDDTGMLRSLPTGTSIQGGGKPPHRVRQRYNFIHSIVEGKVSAATQVIPSYEIVPSTTEPQDQEAAQLSEKVALYGYQKWNIRRMATELVTHALVQGEGFAYPYWDTNVGPFTQDAEGESVGMGEVKVKVFSAQEVFWEAGQSFEDSRWHAVEQAMYIGDVYDLPNYIGGELEPNASTQDNPTMRSGEKMVVVTEYLERPSKMNPKGRRIFLAGERVICTPEDFPIKDHAKKPVDEPALIRLSYIVDPTQDRDRGLVPLLIDPQRTINDCWGKIIEWKNRCLNPQILAPVGSLTTPLTDIPGAKVEFRPIGGQVPQWQPTPPIPGELFQILQESITEMRVIAADIDVQAEPDLAARTAITAVEQSKARWVSFIADEARVHSDIMRRCLWLVQQHYSEPRLLSIQGSFGADLIPNFRGADLLGQADVRVSPGTLEARSRTAITQEAMAFSDRGWIDGPSAMAAINGGVAEKIGQDWALDVGRVNRIMLSIRQGNFMDAFPPHTQKAPQVDPETQQPVIGLDGQPIMVDVEVPGWVPRAGVDNVAVHKKIITMWMKTTEWDRLKDEQRQAGELYFQTLQQIEADEQATAQLAMQQQAQELGQANASKEQKAPAMPDQPNMDGPIASEALA